jgi:hypothetical protein
LSELQAARGEAVAAQKKLEAAQGSNDELRGSLVQVEAQLRHAQAAKIAVAVPEPAASTTTAPPSWSASSRIGGGSLWLAQQGQKMRSPHKAPAVGEAEQQFENALLPAQSLYSTAAAATMTVQAASAPPVIAVTVQPRHARLAAASTLHINTATAVLSESTAASTSSDSAERSEPLPTPRISGGIDFEGEKKSHLFPVTATVQSADSASEQARPDSVVSGAEAEQDAQASQRTAFGDIGLSSDFTTTAVLQEVRPAKVFEPVGKGRPIQAIFRKVASTGNEN